MATRKEMSRESCEKEMHKSDQKTLQESNDAMIPVQEEW